MFVNGSLAFSNNLVNNFLDNIISNAILAHKRRLFHGRETLKKQCIRPLRKNDASLQDSARQDFLRILSSPTASSRVTSL
jgi:polyphosphate kinase